MILPVSNQLATTSQEDDMDTRTRSRNQLVAVISEQIDRHHTMSTAKYAGRPYLPTPRHTPATPAQVELLAVR